MNRKQQGILSRAHAAVRTAICLAAMAAACAPAMGQASANAAKPLPFDRQPLALDRQIAALVAQPAIARAHWGIMVTALDGTPIYALNQAQLFHPASNTKLFTTAAAMALLGPQTTVSTGISIVGYYADKEHFKGDLYIDGGGDANLSGRAVPYAPNTDEAFPPLRYLDELAAQVASTGLKTLDGDVIAFGGVPSDHSYAEGWSVDDLPWGYAAPVTMLSINDNQLKLTIMPGAAADDPAILEVSPAIPYYTVTNDVMTGDAGEGTQIAVNRMQDSKQLHIYGYISLNDGPVVEHVAIDDPVEFAAMALKQLLGQHGVSVTGRARAEYTTAQDARSFRQISHEPLDLAKMKNIIPLADSGFFHCASPCNESKAKHNYPVASHTSPTLGEDVVLTNKSSLNLHAELLLFRLGYRFGNMGTWHSNPFAEGARVVRQFLVDAGINGDDFEFYDGSGLSTYDLVTPRATAKLLSYAAYDPKTGVPQPWFAEWKASLPIGGVDGTLQDRFTQQPLKGHVFAKTGTYSEGRALSGYLECASGRMVVFSILVDNHLPGDNADRVVMDKIVAAIAAAE